MSEKSLSTRLKWSTWKGANDMDKLTFAITGEVILPDDTAYTGLQNIFNQTGNPAMIARPKTNADIVTAIQFARDNGLKLAVRSGGHGLSGLATNDGGLVIDLSHFSAVEVLDADRVRIGGGAKWGDAAAALAEHGLAISSGDTTSVGVGGLTLGGGIGWMVRKYGLTIDNLEAAEVVTADGQTLRVSADEHADLFWALRGGGGNFGVVTAFEFRAQPVKAVVHGTIIYPIAETESVLKKWSAYMRTAPEELSSTLVVFPGFGPQVPPQLFVLAVYAGDDEAAANTVIQPLLELGAVQSQDIQTKPYHALLEEAPPRPGGLKMISESGFIKTLSDEAGEAIAANFGQPGQPILQIRSLGGAVAKVNAGATAFAHRDSEMVFWSVKMIPADTTPEEVERIRQTEWQSLKPFSAGAYVNFLSDVSGPSVSAAYPAATYARLAAVKAAYDPDNVFNQNHNVKPGVGIPA
jgi:FAD/FMN-containing dehydrogenase